MFGAVAVSAVLLGVVASPALAAPGDAGTGAITIHKLEQPSGNHGENDGTDLGAIPGAVPLEAGFTVCQVDGIDLAVQSEWLRLEDVSVTAHPVTGAPVVTESGAPLALTGCSGEQFTDETTGETTFSALAADRAYVVYESTLAENAVSAAAPTLLTIPYPGNGSGDEWNYSPHIYPKNVITGSGAAKSGQVIGDKVSFEVTLPIMPLGPSELYSEVRIDDQLSASLQYTGGEVVLNDADGDPVALVAGTDYTLTAPVADTPGQLVTLNFLAPGLALIDANIGGKIILRMQADAIETGSTENEAKITLNGTTGDQGPEVTNPKNFFSNAHVLTKAKNKGETGSDVALYPNLAGAEFDVYTTADSATNCPATPDPAETLVFSNQESGADGKTPAMVLAEGKYCVYEVVIPSGYKGLIGGELFTVAGEDAEVVVVNTQVGADAGDLPGLPVTGAAGTVLLIAGGGVLLLLGMVLVARRRRGQQQEQQIS